MATRTPLIDEDMHVHSTFSDGTNTLAENAAAAERIGLRRMCCVDHVRRDTGWVADFVSAVRYADTQTPVQLLCGLEAKILDVAGTLDMPDDIDGVDLVYAADHRFPLGDRCYAPSEIRGMLRDGVVSRDELTRSLLSATTNVLERYDRIVVAHLFSVLPKVGIHEDDVPLELLERLAVSAARSGAMFEVDERWRCPGLRALRVLQSRGVPILWSSDAHRSSDIGRYDYNATLYRALSERRAA